VPAGVIKVSQDGTFVKGRSDAPEEEAAPADWISGFLELTEGLPTPPTFRLWSAIAAVGAAMERRCWVEFNRNVTYPNLFTVLCGPPGTGKGQALVPARELLKESKAVLLSPNDMTKAALVDTLAESKRQVVLQRGEPPTIYHTLCVVAPEFGTLVSAHDVEFLNTLNDLFDCRSDYDSRRRGHHGGRTIQVPRPHVSILSGTQPGYLGELLPESAWIMGFTSRLILVYAGSRERINAFAERDERSALRRELVSGLQKIARLCGPFRRLPDFERAFQLWIDQGLPPSPDHSRLAHYVARRDIHCMKLCMIASTAARGDLTLRLEDFERARSWLLGAELAMPDIFRDMSMKSDTALMNECHRYCFQLWTRSAREVSERKPVHRSEIMRFLGLRCPAEKAFKVLELLTQAQWLMQIEGTFLFVPKARSFTASE
jgi:hypothetical protein